MTKTGTITLYDRLNDVISIKKYDGSYERNNIIASWRKMYASGFLKCFYIIAPYISEQDLLSTGKDGVTIKQKRGVVYKYAKTSKFRKSSKMPTPHD